VTTKNWKDFREVIEHEITPCDIILSSEGYRVDERKGCASGIRDYSGVKDSFGNKLKCCDYFYLFNNSFFCLEFSNLYRQYIDCTIRFTRIKNIISKKSKQDTKPILRLVNSKNIIFAEIIKKFRDTDFLLNKIYHTDFTQIGGLPDISSLSRYFFIIWHFHNESEINNIYKAQELSDIDIARLFDSIQDTLRNELCRQPFWKLNGEKIFIIILSEFQELYC
jgi:hypothetical protein